MAQVSISRRSFLIASTGIVATSITGAIISTRAADANQLDPNSPSAVALGYVTNHQRVDTNRWPKKASADSRCANCVLFGGDGAQGACRVFSNQLVSANGWCNAWTKR